MNSKHIAAIEIGSSRVKGIVAAVESDGRIKTLAIEEAPTGDAVRYGRVQNARETSDLINDILRRLENAPQVAPGHISTVFIADGGRSLKSFSSDASINIGGPEEITHRILDRLHREARFNLGTELDILAVAPRRYFVDSSEVKKIVGTFGSSVRGEFTLITQSPENHRALDRLVIESHGEDVRRDYVTRLLAQTEMALTDSERQIGVLFIDFGAETTSMAAFRDGALVFAATLPIGAANITRDLSSGLLVTLDKAENIKRTKGQAVVDRTKFDAPDDEVREIVDFVSSRAGEIIANVVNIIDEAGFRTSDFPDGIVISGGGTKLKGFTEMVESVTKMKVRRAEIDNTVTSAIGALNAADDFDIVAIAKYAAAHSDIDSLSFPEGIDKPVIEETPASTPVRPAPEPQRVSQGLRREVKEDDPDLLKDDDPLDQPDNVNDDVDRDNDLPDPDNDPNKTRLTLMERIKNLFGSPFEAEDKGMDL